MDYIDFCSKKENPPSKMWGLHRPEKSRFPKSESLMPRSRKINREKVQASLDTPCPKAHSQNGEEPMRQIAELLGATVPCDGYFD